MGRKGGGGRVGFGNPTNKGPKNLGGRGGAGGRVVGGPTGEVLRRVAGGETKGYRVTLSNFQRQSGLASAEALAEVDRLVASGQAEYAYLSDLGARILRSHGRDVPERNGRPVSGFTMTV